MCRLLGAPSHNGRVEDRQVTEAHGLTAGAGALYRRRAPLSHPRLAAPSVAVTPLSAYGRGARPQPRQRYPIDGGAA